MVRIEGLKKNYAYSGTIEERRKKKKLIDNNNVRVLTD